MTLSVNWMQGRNVSARDDRNLIYALVSQSAGVVERSNFRVSAASTGLRVLVEPGDLFITGDAIARQGSYHVWNDAQATVNLAGAPAAGTRFDTIAVQVLDPEYDSTAPAVNLLYLPGTVGSGGPVDVSGQPGTVYVLAVVEVRAGVVTVNADRIVDRREIVRGRDQVAYRVVEDVMLGIGSNNPTRTINADNIRLDRPVDMLEGPLYLSTDYPAGARSALSFNTYLDYVGTPPPGVPARIEGIGDTGWVNPNGQAGDVNGGRETIVVPVVWNDVPAGVWSVSVKVSWAGTENGTLLRKLTGTLKPLRLGPVS